MSEARTRLLDTASRLFYAEGLHAVGIDRVVAEAHVTRATLYRHFPSKDDLIVAYLTETDEVIRDRMALAQSAATDADDAIRMVAQYVAENIRGAQFRGCAFLNAAAEYPDPEHPVHKAVLKHRQWFLTTMVELFSKTGKIDAKPAAQHFVMMRDGAMAAGFLSDPDPICATLLRGVEGLLTYRSGLGEA
jgi:AcrR family transcriptional regulator